LRIAVVSPLFESVPPKLYGGTERIVSYLTEEFVRLGQDVTLFASADSRTKAKLRPMARCGLRLDGGCQDTLVDHLIMLDEIADAADQFDIIHFNIDYLHFPFSRRLRLPAISTLHGRLDLPDLARMYRHFDDVPLVSISDAQRTPLPWANWIETVHHGLPRNLYRFHPKHGDYLAFLGRMSEEKRPDRAIEIARRSGMRLLMAAKVDRGDRPYYDQTVVPMLKKARDVEFVGEIGEAEKNDFLGKALALLFPIDWPEPFGLVMIEAMACGVPVIAFPNGSVREIIEEGVTGFVVETIEQAVAAVEKCKHIDRRACRLEFERRFSVERMARDYLNVYQRMVGIEAVAA
jgi:glycosyltransferase involved in cell wall biosynthesis